MKRMYKWMSWWVAKQPTICSECRRRIPVGELMYAEVGDRKMGKIRGICLVLRGIRKCQLCYPRAVKPKGDITFTEDRFLIESLKHSKHIDTKRNIADRLIKEYGISNYVWKGKAYIKKGRVVI